MKFQDVYRRLESFRAPNGDRLLFLLSQQTMQQIYACVLRSGARDCLELGTGYGATSCVIAAALDERGEGSVTTVDLVDRDPIGVHVLAQHTGLDRYIKAVTDSAGYNWWLGEQVARQTSGGVCAPCFDFCFLDGAHEWQIDALAAFLSGKLLRPGGWLLLDDLTFRLRGSHPHWETLFAGRSERELDAYQVAMVYDLVVRQHPDFHQFTLSDAGRMGWARKRSEAPAAWQPTGYVLDPAPWTWSASFAAASLVPVSQRSEGIHANAHGDFMLIQATKPDPWFSVPVELPPGSVVDTVSISVRLLEPASETLQIYWVDEPEQNFAEEQSARASLSAADEWTELTFRINDDARPRALRAIRFDLTDAPSTVLWRGITLGTQQR